MVLKELTHRGNELKELGWSLDDVQRYIDLWDYRQRWGAINLEREDRQFLRKAEGALPVINKNKSSSVKKPLKEKSYYRWLLFYLKDMKEAEANYKISKGSRGLWSVLLEEELKILDYYEPVLGLPDTLKAKKLIPLREELVSKSIIEFAENIVTNEFEFDFVTPLKELKGKQSNNWKDLREGFVSEEKQYPVIGPEKLENFRELVRKELIEFVLDNFPSLAETEKPVLPHKTI